jgi:4,5-DOPA dioxygenase extradiol
MPLPCLFLTQGPPEFHLEMRRYSEFLNHLSARLPKPKAITLISAYWEHPIQQITGAAELSTFLQQEHRLSYPAKGDILLSLDIQSRLAADSIRAEIDDQCGLEPGVSSLLRLLYPKADIPVVALSVNPRLVPEEHYRIGQTLQGLRGQGVFIIGCGVVHHSTAAVRFDDWLNERIQLWDLEALFDYERRAPIVHGEGTLTANTHLHLAPLLICMGAGEPELKGRRLYKEYVRGGLCLSSWQFD